MRLLPKISFVLFTAVLTISVSADSLETVETEATVDGACSKSPSFWGDKHDATTLSCQNAETTSVSLHDFLQSAVFGQATDDEDKTEEHPFLSFLENHRNKPSLLSFVEAKFNGSKTEGDEAIGGNPFLAFVDVIQQTRASILGGQAKDDNTPEDTAPVLAKVLEKARQLAQQDEEANAIGVKEFVSIMKEALQKVTKQLQDNFGELLSTNIDAYMALAIPYYAMAHDSRNSPLSKRKLHRFYQKVTKDEWIDLHDALYLSQLAYVHTIEQFEQGLEHFDDNSWIKLYGSTQSMPHLPASVMLIHKELDPLNTNENGNKNNNGRKKRYSKDKQQNPLEAIQQAIHNLGKPSQTEVLVTIVVRGTKSMSDLLQDGMLEPEEYRGGYAHGGILASGKNLAKHYLPKLQDLHSITQRDKIRVILIGHSLGAGAAAIAAMELREHEFLEVEAVGFGCPSLLSKELSKSTKDYITTVVNDADIVSRMSGASMTNILLDLMDYDWTNDALEDLEYSLERARESFPEFAGFFPETKAVLEWFEARLNDVVRPNLMRRTTKERLENILIPPGDCIHIFRDGYGMSGTYTPCDFFDSVEFSLTLLDDHMILTGYNRALLAAAQDSDRDYNFQFAHNVNGIIGI